MIEDTIHRAAPTGCTEALHDGLFRLASAPATAQLSAFIDQERTLSFVDLAWRATQLAAYLNENGVGPSDHVVVRGRPSFERVIAIYGILIAGASYVPVSTTAPSAQVHAINRQAAVTTVLGDDNMDIELITSSPVMWSLNYAEFLGALPENRTFVQSTYPVAASQCAYIMFGQASDANGVAFAHTATMNALQDAARRFAVQPTDRLFASSDIDCNLSLFDLFMPSLTGCATLLHYTDPTGPSDSAAAIPEARRRADALGHATLWAADAAQMAQVLDEAAAHGIPLSTSIRHLLACGERLTAKTKSELALHLVGADTRLSLMSCAPGVALWSGIVAGNVESAAGQDAVPLLRPIANVHLYVLDDAGHQCPPGVIGTLHVGGSGLALGHVHGAEFTRSSFHRNGDPCDQLGERLSLTGQVARPCADGAIELLANVDDVASSGALRLARVDAAVLPMV